MTSDTRRDWVCVKRHPAASLLKGDQRELTHGGQQKLQTPFLHKVKQTMKKLYNMKKNRKM